MGIANGRRFTVSSLRVARFLVGADTLTISDVTDGDEGTYTCMMNTSLDMDSASAMLTVVGTFTLGRLSEDSAEGVKLGEWHQALYFLLFDKPIPLEVSAASCDIPTLPLLLFWHLRHVSLTSNLFLCLCLCSCFLALSEATPTPAIVYGKLRANVKILSHSIVCLKPQPSILNCFSLPLICRLFTKNFLPF